MKKITKKCKYCGNVFTPIRSSLEKNCQEIDCRTAYAMEVIAKKKQSEANAKQKIWNKEKKALKESLFSLSDYEREAKKVFQKWVRLRDKDLPCISCGNSKTNDWAGGHYYPAGMYSGLIFDERNCHKQCNTYCNKHLSGNLIEYRKGLIKRYGINFVEELEAIANEKRNYKYTKNELIAKKLQYEIKIKEIESKKTKD